MISMKRRLAFMAVCRTNLATAPGWLSDLFGQNLAREARRKQTQVYDIRRRQNDLRVRPVRLVAHEHKILAALLEGQNVGGPVNDGSTARCGSKCLRLISS